MAKRKRSNSEGAIQRRVKEGRGQGEGAAYQPWLRIQDVPSQGLVSRIKGWKTGRCHHLLSQLECQYFYLLEWSPIVTDIREQFPLPLAETLALAERLGVAHPQDPRTRQPVVMTTDFVLTVEQAGRQREQARCLKYARDLAARRTLEKLEIERLYWAERGVDWGIVTEHEVDGTCAANVAWVHPYYAVEALTPLTAPTVERVQSVLTPRVRQARVPLRDLTEACDDQLGLSPGMSLSVVRHLIARRQWCVDMRQTIQPAQPLQWCGVANSAEEAGAA
jgi:TnsA endonuclease N terminal/TnsA endonuclease C terminal